MPILDRPGSNLLLPTSAIVDVRKVNQPDNLERVLNHLTQILLRNNIATNQKDIGIYSTQEAINGQQFFLGSNVQGEASSDYRQLVIFGGLPNTGVKQVAIDIPQDSNFKMTRFYAAASDTTNFRYIPLPYASPVLANNIELEILPILGVPTIQITTGSNRTNFDVTLVVIEYLKI